MPIYEYKCKKCDKEFEELVFVSEDPVKCPSCESEETEKLLSCCRHKTAGGASVGGASTASSGSGCSGCSASSCAGCR